MVYDFSAFVYSQRKSISDLIASNEIVQTGTIGGRVLHKSILHTSKTKKFFFYVLVTDETAGLLLMVYGKPHHQEIEEGKYYSFRKLIRDEAGQVKVTSETTISEIGIFNIPEEVEKKAWQLFSKSPFYSVEHFKTLNSGTGSVTGTVTEVSSGFALSATFFTCSTVFSITNTEDTENIFA